MTVDNLCVDKRIQHYFLLQHITDCWIGFAAPSKTNLEMFGKLLLEIRSGSAEIFPPKFSLSQTSYQNKSQ
jgi:hypothetical protein